MLLLSCIPSSRFECRSCDEVRFSLTAGGADRVEDDVKRVVDTAVGVDGVHVILSFLFIILKSFLFNQYKIFSNIPLIFCDE